ncbi:MAG: N-acetylmuramoyl-L-alanine amidase [Clostridiales bacterium]|jgi:N-acetylmuramoyl-L-alanine amidase|nr:N-acetylmuramoyl-L-alanine amidase [Clostridiales bacterium]
MNTEYEWAVALAAGVGMLAAGAAGYFIGRKCAGETTSDSAILPQTFGAPVITDKLLTPGASHGRTGQKLNAKGVVIHYVANPGSSALANRNYFENGSDGNGTSCHYIVGLQGEILRLIPENERAMHAGRAYGAAWTEQAKTNNSTYLGIEVCHPDKTGKFSAVTYKALIELTADICERHGFNAFNNVKRHYDVTGKLCPLYYVNNPSAWEQMKTDIHNAMSAGVQVPPKETGPSDWAEKSWEWAIENGVTDGTRPRDKATREECASMIYRAMGADKG